MRIIKDLHKQKKPVPNNDNTNSLGNIARRVTKFAAHVRVVKVVSSEIDPPFFMIFNSAISQSVN